MTHSLAKDLVDEKLTKIIILSPLRFFFNQEQTHAMDFPFEFKYKTNYGPKNIGVL